MNIIWLYLVLIVLPGIITLAGWWYGRQFKPFHASRQKALDGLDGDAGKVPARLERLFSQVRRHRGWFHFFWSVLCLFSALYFPIGFSLDYGSSIGVMFYFTLAMLFVLSWLVLILAERRILTDLPWMAVLLVPVLFCFIRLWSSNPAWVGLVTGAAFSLLLWILLGSRTRPLGAWNLVHLAPLLAWSFPFVTLGSGLWYFFFDTLMKIHNFLIGSILSCVLISIPLALAMNALGRKLDSLERGLCSG